MRASVGDWAILGQAIGVPSESVLSSIGSPTARQRTGPDLWLVFRSPGLLLRVRCDARRESVPVASWTVSFDAGPPTLREAAEPFGLWPACEPDVAADAPNASVIRRAVPGAAPGRLYTFTAAASRGRICRMALFDEPPDWL